MRVQVVNAVAADEVGDLHGLIGGFCVVDTARFQQWTDAGKCRVRLVASCPHVAYCYAFGRDVGYWGYDAGEVFLQTRLGGRAQSNDLNIQPRRLVCENFVENERLGVAREAFEHVPHAQAKWSHAWTP